MIFQQDGNVVFGRNFIELSSDEKKAAVQVIAKRVTESMVEKKQTLQCSCGIDDGVVGTTKCFVVETKRQK